VLVYDGERAAARYVAASLARTDVAVDLLMTVDGLTPDLSESWL
jgi:hypothetical protein